MASSSSESGTVSNALGDQQSPYLLQHADNPVHWQTWGQHAFDLAKSLDKPIFLSVGYSSCHWCHVMEVESFQNERIAKLMNDYFVNIKVDREERPDVDSMYMNFVQATTGSGGWPMSVFLTPCLRPFLGGTYFPAQPRYGQPSFPSVLHRVHEMWSESRALVEERATKVLEALRQAQNTGGDGIVAIEQWPTIVEKTTTMLLKRFDRIHGGYSQAPKFPRVSELLFLLNLCDPTKVQNFVPPNGGDESKVEGQLDCMALSSALFSLRKMAHGGIHDVIGGGFCRYSVDERWHIPHFEKMLYDNAQLIEAYTIAFQRTEDVFFARIVVDIVDYILRDLSHTEGGFFSAEDADSFPSEGASQKREGAFYLWTKNEVNDVVGEDDGDVFCYHYYVKDGGNADLSERSDPHGEFRSRNVLIAVANDQMQNTCDHFNISKDDLEAVLRRCKRKLFEVRKLRPRPFLDDKVITSWNGMMISALAKASSVFSSIPFSVQTQSNQATSSELAAVYKTAALKAMAFAQKHLWIVEEDSIRLLRCYRNQAAPVGGFLSDYANMVSACLNLYDITFDEQWLKSAISLQNAQDELFYDSDNGGYFSNSAEDQSILMRLRDSYDGAEPSPSSVSIGNLARLCHFVDSDVWSKRVVECLAVHQDTLDQMPTAMPAMVNSLFSVYDSPKVIVLAGDPCDATMQEFERLIRSRFLRDRVLIGLTSDEQRAYFASLKPTYANMKPRNGKPTAYICEGFTCKPPVSQVSELRLLLEKNSSSTSPKTRPTKSDCDF